MITQKSVPCKNFTTPPPEDNINETFFYAAGDIRFGERLPDGSIQEIKNTTGLIEAGRRFQKDEIEGTHKLSLELIKLIESKKAQDRVKVAKNA